MKMNVKNIEALIEKLKVTKKASLKYNEDGPLCTIPKNGFNMTRYSDSCGTPCCIAGHAVANAKGKVTRCIIDGFDLSINDRAAKKLGISAVWAENHLFDPVLGRPIRIEDVTPKDAIRALKMVAKAGDEHYRCLSTDELWKNVKTRTNRVIRVLKGLSNETCTCSSTLDWILK
jgi:hypothetical protein